MSDLKPTVAVDLDGVLAQYDGWKGVDHIGAPIEGARVFLHDLRFSGYRVLIYTTRTNPGLHREHPGVEALVLRVRAWLIENRMPHDAIYRGHGKPLAAAYIDDRAIRCRPQEREHPSAAYHDALAVLGDPARHEWGEAQERVGEAETGP